MRRLQRLIRRALKHQPATGVQQTPVFQLAGLRDQLLRLPEDEQQFLRFCAQHLDRSHSQIFQDLFVLRTLDEKREGFFCEFGATDGVSLSNSCALERYYGWRGILAEPARGWHAALQRNRPQAIIEKSCVWKTTGEQLNFSEAESRELSTLARFSAGDLHLKKRKNATSYDVETISLNDLLKKHEAPSNLDYLSMDTEGSELEILQNLDFDRYKPAIMTIEHNYTDSRSKVFDLLSAVGYRRVLPGCSLFDDWYVRSDVASAHT